MKIGDDTRAEIIKAEPTEAWASLRPFGIGVGLALLIYLCWRILFPFLPAISFAFALAVIAQPAFAWLTKRLRSRTVASLISVILILAIVVVPTVLLARALVLETTALVQNIGDPARIREVLEGTSFVGRLFRWLDAQIDLAGTAAEILRSASGSVSSGLSSLVAGSVRFFAQAGVSLFVLFYFLRDGEAMVGLFKRILPAPASLIDSAFKRIAQILRVSLGGKFVTASLQGFLGGAIFAWLHLPAPVFWGFVMGVLSLFPVIGAFLVWGPAAVLLLSRGEWSHALFLSGWGIAVINPVDNLLGPILIGTTLRLHTLLTFFSIIGGLAAFGAAGIVIGPIIVAVAVSIVDAVWRSQSPSSE